MLLTEEEIFVGDCVTTLAGALVGDLVGLEFNVPRVSGLR